MASIAEISQLLDKELTKHLQPIKENIQEIKEEFKEIKQELTRYKTRCKETEKELSELKSTVENLNKQIIRKNLIIYGLPEQEDEKLKETFINLCKAKLQISDIASMEIEEIHRLGKNRSEGHPRAVKVVLTTLDRKREILKNTQFLKGTNMSIQKELTKKDMEDRKILKPFLIKARNEGLRSRFMDNKLKIGEKIYNVEDVKKLSKSGTTSEITTNQDGIDIAGEVENFYSPGPASAANTSVYHTPTQIKDTKGYNKRKDISPLSDEEDDESLRIEVEDIRSQPFTKKPSNKKIGNTTQSTLPLSFFRQRK